VRIFNSERRLLAWRLGDDAVSGEAPDWRAEAARAGNAAPLPLAEDMPAASARLFAALPQGWGAWRRVASWPAGGAGARLRLDLHALLAHKPAGAHLRLMLAGRLLGVRGAQVASSTPA